jgi:hypothetical protein
VFQEDIRTNRLPISRRCSVEIVVLQRAINHINYHAVNFDVAPGFEQLQRSILRPERWIHIPFLENLFEQ